MIDKMSRKDEIIKKFIKHEVGLTKNSGLKVVGVCECRYDIVATEIEKLYEGKEQPRIELVFKRERELGIRCCQIVCAYYDGRVLNCCAGFKNSGSIIKHCLGYRPKPTKS